MLKAHKYLQFKHCRNSNIISMHSIKIKLHTSELCQVVSLNQCKAMSLNVVVTQPVPADIPRSIRKYHKFSNA